MARFSVKRLALCVVFAAFAAGCNDSPTSPSRLKVNADADASAEKLAGGGRASTKGGNFSGNLNEATVENETDLDAFFTLIIWDYADGVNQIEVGHSDPIWIERHSIKTLYTNAFEQDPCKQYQRDVYKNLKQAERYTMSDVPYPYAASEKLVGPTQHCRKVGEPEPPVVVPPVVPEPPSVPVPPSTPEPPSVPEPPTTPEPPVVPPPPPPIPPPPPPPQCSGSGTYNFNPESSTIASFPDGFPAPWLPSSLGPFVFAIPAGTWDIAVVTGDTVKEGEEPQLHEQAIIEFGGPGGPEVSGPPTTDVPDVAPRVITTHYTMNFSSAVSMIAVVHAIKNSPEPSNSLFVSSVTYSCPQR